MNWALTKPGNRRKDPFVMSALSHRLPAGGAVGPRCTAVSFNAGSPFAGERGCEEVHIC